MVVLRLAIYKKHKQLLYIIEKVKMKKCDKVVDLISIESKGDMKW